MPALVSRSPALQEPRDPRFLPLAGELNPQHFASSYAFLSDLHSSEVKTLRDNLKRARKMVVSSPQDQRAEREAEVARLERALKRAESAVNKDKREKVEREALKKLSSEEKERRKQGKGAWYLKDGAYSSCC
jgi:ribosomal RNA-processing protein 36